MLITNKDGTEQRQAMTFSFEQRNKTSKTAVAIRLSLIDINELLSQSPTELQSSIKRLKSYYYNPIEGKT